MERDPDRERPADQRLRRAPLAVRMRDAGTRWWRKASSRVLLGEELGETVEIATLACPLRVDLHLRAGLFQAFSDGTAPARPTAADLARLPALAGYMDWVRHVALPVGQPQYLADEASIFGAFERRYQRARALWRSVSAEGIHASSRIRLLSGRRIRVPHGKRVRARLFAGDGCHRIACLMVLGRTHLRPEEYEVEERLLLRPHDNTARLLRAGALSRRQWLRFLATRYAPGADPADEGALVARARRLRPELLDELDSVLAYDLPRLPP